MKDYKTAEEIFKENGYGFVKGWIAELEKRNITLLTDREMRAKELVESWELVESYGGLDCAIKASQSEYRRTSQPWVHYALQVAIANVESCT